MSNSFRAKKKASKPSEKRPSSLSSGPIIPQNGQLPFIAGVFLIMLSVFLLIAFFSYVFTGSSDQDVLQESMQNVLSKLDKKTNNTLGWFGANIAHWFIYIWFGISAFLLIPILFFFWFSTCFQRRPISF